MPIQPHTLGVLEFGRVREALAERAETRMGRERALSLAPTTDPAVVRAWLEQVENALSGVSLSLGGITDVRHTVASLTEGS